MMKRCIKCNVEKSLDDFYRASRNVSGYMNTCKECDLARCKRRYQIDPDRIKAKVTAWNLANPEKQKARDAAHYVKNRIVANQRGAQYYLANKAACNAQSKIWAAKNKERVTELNRQKRIRNGDRIRTARRAHYTANKVSYVANARKRETDKLRATPAWADLAKIEAFYELRERLTLETGILHHVDHIDPLRHPRLCGLHVHYNLRVIPAAINLRKRNKLENEV